MIFDNKLYISIPIPKYFYSQLFHYLMKFVLFIVFNIDYIGNGIEELDFCFWRHMVGRSTNSIAFRNSLVIEDFVSIWKISNVMRMRSMEGNVIGLYLRTLLISLRCL